MKRKIIQLILRLDSNRDDCSLVGSKTRNNKIAREEAGWAWFVVDRSGGSGARWKRDQIRQSQCPQ